MECFHFSSALSGDRAVLSPARFGQGCATRGDRRGLPKVFLFAFGSTLGADARILGWRPLWWARVDEGTLYDARGSDPLGWKSLPDREEADSRVLACHYAGVRFEREDGADVVVLFRPINVVRREL